MSHIIALIDGGPGDYGAAFPDCPGCTAMGATIDEATANAEEALREWIGDRVTAGLAPPDARSIDALLVDREEGEAVAGAVLVAAIPLILDQSRSTRAPSR